MNEPAISINQLRVVRGGRAVLHGLDLDIERGCITGLLGPSGCGKTTMMRAIVGVQIVESGAVTVLGDPAGVSKLRSRVAYVTQAPSVYDDLTVEANLLYFARLYGVAKHRIPAAIDAVGLSEHSAKLVRNLSGGQRTRASLATALLAEPEILILDEPTVGLDPVLRVELWDTFRQLAERGATLLVSSHVMDEAERCDQLILMREGKLLAHCPPGQLLQDTGTANVEDAFLSLVRQAGVAA